MRKDVLQTGRIAVLDDSGRALVVDEYSDALGEGTISFPGAEIVGLREYRLGDDPCNIEKDGSFVVVRTGQRLRRRTA